ncbi:hypothetical protein FE782_20320 [Paenibacillus antri]|uniref:Uncharacterized protein n=1 Tax=Paenibacillus antri TaxID=2582848 RepID=A0A5R9GG44_9BACL|nr:hypothetical protein [Paenibacillus antri]TLS50375.1 hypothetical protein FE782_20320 [Paenibacillus antri]
MLKYGLQMDLPEGKRAGYYSQIVKALAEAATVFDRDKELIVVDDEQQRDNVAGVLAKYSVDWEPIALWLLPEGTELDARAEDFGFVSKFGNAYLYADRVSRFRFADPQPAGAELAPALLQIEEFVVFAAGGDDAAAKTYFAESHLRETIEGIASRYGASVQFS